ncbi:type 2 isopentenyl-diphosphate Delta-isomerase [Mesobacillus selenatarsenatis]|uniref:Isopentenyl-diphosphate delta-isomerase n=1 Tax=Mesobacillus selenatarsenatis TaxID=388741 RepID=A0A846TNJ5_9BACI|nr:type 2 isopentenyl-diphosphate Delta-isomerase [Mesobacillus selenatarsenatis]NKE04011.1 type 2 isopentenyl-diphosphate Delta-isomerase [Mesobacillus selenatarsenatis]
MNQYKDVNKRKADHIQICLHDDVKGRGVTTGFEQFSFIHQALPEVDFTEINVVTFFLKKKVATPFLISSMTGGTEKAMTINRNLAIAAEEKGWSFGVGSGRAAVEDPERAYTFRVRKYAPSIPIIANVGAVQLNYGFGVDECKKIVDLVEADALVLHLNSLQELIQPEGNTNFRGLFQKIEDLCKSFSLPIGVKEVGWGINSQLAKALVDVGISFIDVAGAGGTNWSQVEKLRSTDPLKVAVADAISGLGIPTAECILDIKQNGGTGTLIASGGLNNGVEAAKAIALGADLAGFGRSILAEAVTSEKALMDRFTQTEYELKAAMFSIGAASLNELKNTSSIKRVGSSF